MSSYLVTGGCGFIGSHLVDHLQHLGHEVCVLDDLSTGKRSNLRQGTRVIEACISDRDAVRRAVEGVDGIFHLAAVASVQRSNEAWAECHAINLSGAINVFDAARSPAGRGAVPVVYASSAAVYGDTASPLLNEYDRPAPLTAYGADKYGCELHGRVASLVHRVPTTGLRFFNVYGPRQDPHSPYSGVISIFAERVSHGLPLEIQGNGEQTRDFVCVADVVRALDLAMNRIGDVPLVVNVCTGRPTSINLLARLVMQARELEVPVLHVEARRGDIRSSTGDPSLARQKLGFAASFTLIEGLRTWLAEETAWLGAAA
jgi:UDP-glucose 4-epimerase